MRQYPRNNKRVLAIDPSTKGFGFAVLEGPERLVDWGTKTIRGDKNSQCLMKIAELIEYYQPNIILVEDPTGQSSRRCLRVQQLIEEILVLTSARKVKAKTFSRSDVRKVFSQYGGVTKHQIATTIARRFPELVPHLPRLRKPWMSEDERMSMFDAVALALSFLDSKQVRSCKEVTRIVVKL